MPESAMIAHIDIQDVQVTVLLLAERAACRRISGNVALVWRDANGLACWLAAPQQQPFFDAVRLDRSFRVSAPGSREIIKHFRCVLF